MTRGISIEDVVRAGGKIQGLPRRSLTPIIDQLALKIMGVLADTTDSQIRKKALQKALVMLSRGGKHRRMVVKQ